MRGLKFLFMSMTVMVLLLTGCAASLENVKLEKVTLCENQRCRYLTDADSKEELLVKIFNLLKGSEDKDSDLFESSPEKRTFEKKGISLFVQGGPIPGRGNLGFCKVYGCPLY